MAKSTITVKYQTTVPKEVRQRLGARPGDVLQWQLMGDHIRVTTAAPGFLSLRGTFEVGPGDPVDDVKKARELMGRGDR